MECPFCGSSLVAKLSNMERCGQCAAQWNQEQPLGIPAQSRYRQGKREPGKREAESRTQLEQLEQMEDSK
jgi:hypothetical protein